MKRFFPIILLLFSWNLLQAQVPIRYPNLRNSLILELNKIVLPGAMEEALNQFISMGLASSITGKWEIAVIDSMHFEEGTILEDVGPWGWVGDDGLSPGYPFKNGIAQKPKYLEYTKITIDKGDLKVTDFSGFRNNPPRSFMEATFPSNTFLTKEVAEKRRNDKIKEK